MQSTRPASIRLFRISPSPDWADDIEPLASTKPAVPRRRQVMDDVLHPGEVGVALGRRAVAPALVVGEPLAAPIGDVEGRVGEDEVSPEVGVAVVVEAVAVGDLALDAADGEVHLRDPPGRVVRLLSPDRDVVARLAAVAVARGVGVG